MHLNTDENVDADYLFATSAYANIKAPMRLNRGCEYLIHLLSFVTARFSAAHGKCATPVPIDSLSNACHGVNSVVTMGTKVILVDGTGMLSEVQCTLVKPTYLPMQRRGSMAAYFKHASLELIKKLLPLHCTVG